jgi:acyl-CoA dehydrogenase
MTIDFDLPEELQLFQKMMRRFVDRELIPLESSGELDEATRDALREKAKAAGLWMLDVPEELGGQGLGALGMSIFWEELSRTVAVAPRDTRIFRSLIGPILLGLEGAQKERFLMPIIQGTWTPCFAITEADAGSDPALMRTQAVRDGDDYVINGVKRFITDARQADVVQLIAYTDRSKGLRGLSCFLVEMRTPGVAVTADYDTMMGDRPCEVTFENVRVPAANLVGVEGDGMALAQRWITEGRILRHGARSLGVAERCLELGVSYTRQRQTFGAPLATRQAIQFMLADTYAELQQARLLVRDAALDLDRGRDVRLKSWIAKSQGTEMGFRAVDRCMQMHGGLGLTTEMPIERMWREQRSYTITEGAAEVMRASIARKVYDIYE